MTSIAAVEQTYGLAALRRKCLARVVESVRCDERGIRQDVWIARNCPMKRLQNGSWKWLARKTKNPNAQVGMWAQRTRMPLCTHWSRVPRTNVRCSQVGLLTYGRCLPHLPISMKQWCHEEAWPITVAGPCRIFTDFP